MKKPISIDNELAKKYWVIWYPTFLHKDSFEVVKNPIEEKLNDKTVREDAKDKNWFEKSWLKLFGKYYDKRKFTITIDFVDKNKQLLSVGNNIKESDIIIKYNTDKNEKEIFLENLQNSSNGLFLYKCTADTTQTIENLEKQVTTHFLKQVCHKHIFHGFSSNEDSYSDFYFEPYVPKNGVKPNIKKENNGAIKWHLQQFCLRCSRLISKYEEEIIHTKNKKNIFKRIISFLRKSSSSSKSEHEIKLFIELENWYKERMKEQPQYEKVWEKIKKRSKRQISKFIKNQNKIKKRFRIRRSHDIMNAVGETLYFKSLQSSKYLNPKDDEVRKNLLNLENSFKALSFFAEYFQTEDEEKKHKISIKLALLGMFITLFIGLFFPSPLSSNIISSTQICDSYEKIKSLFIPKPLIINENEENLIQVPLNNEY